VRVIKTWGEEIGGGIFLNIEIREKILVEECF